jgi:hypothetical protein
LEYTNGRLLKNMKTIRGRVIAASAREIRSEEARRSNRRESLDVSVRVTSQWCAQEAAVTKLRVHHGLLVANIWSRTIMKVLSMLLAAVSAPRGDCDV